jgi:hypothetical protein
VGSACFNFKEDIMPDQRKQQNQRGGQYGQQGGDGQKPGQQQQQQPNKKPSPGEQQAEHEKNGTRWRTPACCLTPNKEADKIFCDVEKLPSSAPATGLLFWSPPPNLPPPSRFTAGAFGLLWENLKRLVYMERLTNLSGCSQPNSTTKQKT